MGYKAQKTEVENKIKRIKRILLFIAVAFLTALVVFSCFYPPESWKYYFATPKISKRKAGEMRMHFIDVGQGDCTLIELPGGQTVLVDGGDGSARTKKVILRYLNALDIDEINHLVITHADDDHCGAIDEIARMKKVFNAYLPATNEVTDGEYMEAYTALVQSKCKLYRADRTLKIQGEKYGYSLSFLYPYKGMEINETDDNASSAVIWLDYLGVSALLMGDATSEVEKSLLRDNAWGFFQGKGVDLQSTEILKLGHHGSGSSSTLEFLQYLNLRTGIISCGKDNVYGHPAREVMENLSLLDTDVYRTDNHGHILLTVSLDGKYTVKTTKGA